MHKNWEKICNMRNDLQSRKKSTKTAEQCELAVAITSRQHLLQNTPYPGSTALHADHSASVVAFNPGEPVFLQGQRVSDFYGVTGGRLALVAFAGPVMGVSAGEFLAQAKLLGVAEREEIFGEQGAFLDEPQPYSVFALDPGSVRRLPVQQDALCTSLGSHPQFGVQTGISFARTLKQALDELGDMVDVIADLDLLLQNSARSYMAVVNELRLRIKNEKEHVLQTLAESQDAFILAEKICRRLRCHSGSRQYRNPLCVSGWNTYLSQRHPRRSAVHSPGGICRGEVGRRGNGQYQPAGEHHRGNRRIFESGFKTPPIQTNR